MPFRYYSPGTEIFALLVMGVLSFFFGRKKRRSVERAPEKKGRTLEEVNMAAVKKVVDAHADCTAEVIDLLVFGRRRLSSFRCVWPGSPVELRMIRGDIKLFALGEYVAHPIVPNSSNLPRLFEENIPFEAYLGGRDLAFMTDEEYDSCSIIVFYKLPGVPPTKVNLH